MSPAKQNFKKLARPANLPKNSSQYYMVETPKKNTMKKREHSTVTGKKSH
jgi:hypothetical protein